MSEPVYVIPDIHGHKGKLDQKLALIDAHAGASAKIVFLGDLVDRGPDSCGVIQTLIDGIDAGRNWTVLRGNHDQVFLDFIRGMAYLYPFRAGEGWLSDNMGGMDTLASYGIDPHGVKRDWSEAFKAIPQTHIDLLDSLVFSHETEDVFFVHAGIMPGLSFGEQEPEDMLWMREPFLSDDRDHGKLVVHGHTPVNQPTHYGNRVNLDGGAAWGGQLHVAVFEGRDCWLLDGAGRTPLVRET